MRALALAGTAAVLGAALGFAAGRLSGSETAPTEPARLIAEGELSTLPRGPVSVRAEQVVLPAGFSSRHVHGGPTFNFVEDGVVAIEQAGGASERYGRGEFFFEPEGRVHEITVLDDARLRVVRLLREGAAATTEVP